MSSEPDTEELRQILRAARTIAVVGLSADPARPSHEVASYLQRCGYRVIPVNPRYAELLGEKCYPDVRAIPEPVDIVDVFRQAAATVPIASDAVAIGARVLWLQLGVVNDAAMRVAEAGGLRVIMDRCIKIDHVSMVAAGT